MKILKHSYAMISLLLSFAVCAQSDKTIQWIGGPTFLLNIGSFKIIADPMLGPKSEISFRIAKHPVTGELNAAIKRFKDPAKFDINSIDLILISHPHPDHIDDKAVEILDHNLQVITTSNSVGKFEDWGFKRVKGLEWNDTISLYKEVETLDIIAVRAKHTADENLNSELGKVNGYIINYQSAKEGYTIYWSGDTVWFPELESYKKFQPIDLFIPNMGAVGYGKRGLNAEQCIKIITALSPLKVFPVHHSTFSHYTESIEVLEIMMVNTGYINRLRLPDLGEIIKP
ncbi:MAG: MBL fold metallo-hydrolase [Flavobacterium sp.]|nr:MBL fold metallo-hydrolase [Flavobacterium sp.]